MDERFFFFFSEFIYDPSLYDVVVAGSPELFEACSIDHNFGFYHSGHDELIFPVPGTYYFFDRATCLSGNPNMKFFVVVYQTYRSKECKPLSSPTKPAPWREIYCATSLYLIILIACLSIPVKYQ